MRRLLLHLLASAHTETDHVSDAELLRRFAASNDPAAFELIARRHADAVWATCRRLLPCDADAEDAFQTAFLALIRKAKSIRTPCAGGWLHRVAVNASLKLRERARRAAPTEPQQLETVPAAPAEQSDVEAAATVHEELARLSERERLPVVLCDLEGLSHADAAKALGWPVGTVSGRLSRARAKLRERLQRRGVTPSAALLPALAAPPYLVSGALSLTAGAPPAVVLLTEGVLSAMFTAKLKLAVVPVAAFVALAGIGTVFALASKPAPQPAAGPTTAEPPPAAPKEKELPAVVKAGDTITAFPDLVVKDAADLTAKCPKLLGKGEVAIDPKDGALRQLQKAKLNAAVADLRTLVVRSQNGQVADPSAMPTALGRIASSVAEIGLGAKELRPWLEELVRVAKWYEQLYDRFVRTGQGRPGDAQVARFARLEAEIALFKLIDRGKPPGKPDM